MFTELTDAPMYGMVVILVVNWYVLECGRTKFHPSRCLVCSSSKPASFRLFMHWLRVSSLSLASSDSANASEQIGTCCKEQGNCSAKSHPHGGTNSNCHSGNMKVADERLELVICNDLNNEGG